MATNDDARRVQLMNRMRDAAAKCCGSDGSPQHWAAYQSAKDAYERFCRQVKTAAYATYDAD